VVLEAVLNPLREDSRIAGSVGRQAKDSRGEFRTGIASAPTTSSAFTCRIARIPVIE
jgi:hypothetical protein